MEVMFVNVQFSPRHFGTWQTCHVAVSLSGKHFLDIQRLPFRNLQAQFLSSSISFSLLCRTLTLGSYVFTSSFFCLLPSPRSSLLDQVTYWLLLWKKREEASGTSTHSSLRLTSLFSSLGATAASSYLCVLQACVRNNPPGFQAPGAHPSSSSLVFISLGLRHPLPHLLEVVRKKWLHPITLYRGAFSTSLSTSSPPRSPPSYLLTPGGEADITKPAFYHFFWTSLLL